MPDQELSYGYIQLNRTFHELAKHVRERDSFDLSQALFAGPRLSWDTLLKNYRTIILSEAGTGKTEEMRQVANKLRSEGKRAFFLRLENIPEDFEDAFEVGTLNAFTDWLASTDEAWLLLDSVDEARLRSPGDFERAIRKFGRLIQSAHTRAHILVTGRTSAWRPKTDLNLCEQHLPVVPAATRASEREILEEPGIDDDWELDSLGIEDSNENIEQSGFLIVALDDLNTSQIETFASSRGVCDIKAFLDEIERADAASFTTRPQDLEELIEFWTKEHRIGKRLELMQNSIQRRLEEHDQNRRDARPLSAQRAREGARLLAAAAILCREPTIQVPDGSNNHKGIPIQVVLPDWDDQDQLTLLSRPIFDEAIYGTVRFYHRSVREFLTAEWLAGLLVRSTSRREIENLLFRVQYGVQVIVPTMRPVLPWLAIFDERIREKIRCIAPEVLFEGGDPSALPLATRRGILAEVCEHLAAGKSGRSALDYAAVQRFASTDLTDDIRILLGKYESNPELVGFLTRMIWLGRLTSLKNETKVLAHSPATPKYTRIAAIRALHAIATDTDLEDMRRSFVAEAPSLNRDLLCEFVERLIPTGETVAWLLSVLPKVEPKQRYSVDSLTDAVSSFAATVPPEFIPELVRGLNLLLDQDPFLDHGFCRISQKNSWLMKAASVAIGTLIRDRRPEALKDDTLGILHKLAAFRDWDGDARDIKVGFEKLLPLWPDINRMAFWFDVQRTRESHHFAKSGNRLTYYWQVAGRAFWDFGVNDFDYAAEIIRTLPEQDDKLVALSLAFDIYTKNNCPPIWRDRLSELVRGNAELEERFSVLLNPPISEFEREEKQWKRRDAARKKREKDYRAKSKAFILSNLELVRAPQLKTPTDISRAQWYLYERLREKSDRSDRWTIGRWRELIPEFGEEVALAYREGVTNYWRKYRPILRSEGAPSNSTPIFVIFGLAGLDIEAAETPDWPHNLSKDEVLLACRYAVHELNGFPPWLPKLFEGHSDTVIEFLVSEIEQEVAAESPDSESHYLLSDICWSARWVWERLGPELVTLLQTRVVRNPFNLDKLLTVVQGSTSVSDHNLARLAEWKAATSTTDELSAIWYAAWVGVEPDRAIPAVTGYLSTLPCAEVQTRVAMLFVTRLWASRSSEAANVRQAFVKPQHLKELYLLMQTYIRESDDIDRSGGGVYSPDIRDNAQDARNSLFEQLKQIPGKDAFVALDEIARQHPRTASRPWLASYAKSKAEQDADLVAWTPESARDFYEHLDRTPTNHRELAELAVMRILDLKDDLENGDESVAKLLMRVKEEPEMRNFLAHELRKTASGRYTITQEEEFADGKCPDLRFHGIGFDAPVPAELKLAERWTGPKLFERLETQLSGDYLRDNRSRRGIYVLVNLDNTAHWELPGSSNRVDFDHLVLALQDHWDYFSPSHPQIDEITILGIDLAKRFK